MEYLWEIIDITEPLNSADVAMMAKADVVFNTVEEVLFLCCSKRYKEKQYYSNQMLFNLHY